MVDAPFENPTTRLIDDAIVGSHVTLHHELAQSPGAVMLPITFLEVNAPVDVVFTRRNSRVKVRR